MGANENERQCRHGCWEGFSRDILKGKVHKLDLKVRSSMGGKTSFSGTLLLLEEVGLLGIRLQVVRHLFIYAFNSFFLLSLFSIFVLNAHF